jgi:hypothetical protein
MHKSYLSLVPLSAVTKSLTHQLQVTCYIEKILRIRVEYIENCLLTDSQLQFFQNNHDDPSHFLHICLVDELCQFCNLLLTTTDQGKNPEHKDEWMDSPRIGHGTLNPKP